MKFDESDQNSYTARQLAILRGRAKDELSADEKLDFANAAARLISGPEPGDFQLDVVALASFTPEQRMEAADAAGRITQGRRALRNLETELPSASPDGRHAIERRCTEIRRQLKEDWSIWGQYDLSAALAKTSC